MSAEKLKRAIKAARGVGNQPTPEELDHIVTQLTDLLKRYPGDFEANVARFCKILRSKVK